MSKVPELASAISTVPATVPAKLVPIKEVNAKFPWWPYGYDGTLRLIKLKRLGCVRADRRIFVHEQLLQAFIDKHTVPA
jgi:hypothetical protein